MSYESILDEDVVQEYEKETGRKWTDVEEHMAEICSFYSYGFSWNKQGNIVINNGFYEGHFDDIDVNIYTFFGINIEKNKGEYLGDVCLEYDLRHYEYQSAEEMVKDWSAICKQTNQDYEKNGQEIPFPWLQC